MTYDFTSRFLKAIKCFIRKGMNINNVINEGDNVGSNLAQSAEQK